MFSLLPSHHLGGGCSSARCVSDSSSIGRPVLRPPSGLGDGGVETICDVLTPPSSWSASPPLALNYTLVNGTLETVMPFYMSKIGHFAFHYGIQQPILFYISKLLKYRHVCSFLSPWHSKYSSETFHLESIYLLFCLFAEAPCLWTICCNGENKRFQKL